MSRTGANPLVLNRLFAAGQPAPDYSRYFDCFNQQLFFDAHAALETRWLAARGQVDADFFKGLIQLAGAFVHLQRHRPRPAGALFRLAREKLAQYPARYHRLDMVAVRQLIEEWLGELEAGPHAVNPLPRRPTPRLTLEESLREHRRLFQNEDLAE